MTEGPNRITLVDAILERDEADRSHGGAAQKFSAQAYPKDAVHILGITHTVLSEPNYCISKPTTSTGLHRDECLLKSFFQRMPLVIVCVIRGQAEWWGPAPHRTGARSRLYKCAINFSSQVSTDIPCGVAALNSL